MGAPDGYFPGRDNPLAVLDKLSYDLSRWKGNLLYFLNLPYVGFMLNAEACCCGAAPYILGRGNWRNSRTECFIKIFLRALAGISKRGWM